MYLFEYVLIYTVKLVHLLLINGSERDKFAVENLQTTLKHKKNTLQICGKYSAPTVAR